MFELNTRWTKPWCYKEGDQIWNKEEIMKKVRKEIKKEGKIVLLHVNGWDV